ncbi:unnamed protein product, partial [marine sediment metagenome]
AVSVMRMIPQGTQLARNIVGLQEEIKKLLGDKVILNRADRLHTTLKILSDKDQDVPFAPGKIEALNKSFAKLIRDTKQSPFKIYFEGVGISPRGGIFIQGYPEEWSIDEGLRRPTYHISIGAIVGELTEKEFNALVHLIDANYREKPF